MDGNIIAYFTAIVSCLSPIIIAWLTLRNTKAEKNNQEYRKLREEKEARDKEEKEAEAKRSKQEIEAIKTQISTLTTSVEQLTTAQNNATELFRSKAEAFMKMSTQTFEYCQSLTAAVTKTGQALLTEDAIKDARGEIRDALQEHQEEEQRILKEIYKIRY